MGPQTSELAMLLVIHRSDPSMFRSRYSIAKEANDIVVGYTTTFHHNEAVWYQTIDKLVGAKYVVRTINGYELSLTGRKFFKAECQRLEKLTSSISSTLQLL